MFIPILFIIGFVVAAREIQKRTIRPARIGGEFPPAFQKPPVSAFEKPALVTADEAIADLVERGEIEEAMMLDDLYPSVTEETDALPAGDAEAVEAEVEEAEEAGGAEVEVAPISSPWDDVNDELWSELIESLRGDDPSFADGRAFGAWRQPATSLGGAPIPQDLDSQRSTFSRWLGQIIKSEEATVRGLVGKDVELDGACVPITRSGAIALFRCAGKKADRWIAGDRGKHTTEAFTNCNGIF